MRRTYIAFVIAAGYDLPYVQAQVGHSDPAVTLAVYTQVIRHADRDQLRAEVRALLGDAVRGHHTMETAASPGAAPIASGSHPVSEEPDRVAVGQGRRR